MLQQTWTLAQGEQPQQNLGSPVPQGVTAASSFHPHHCHLGLSTFGDFETLSAFSVLKLQKINQVHGQDQQKHFWGLKGCVAVTCFTRRRKKVSHLKITKLKLLHVWRHFYLELCSDTRVDQAVCKTAVFFPGTFCYVKIKAFKNRNCNISELLVQLCSIWLFLRKLLFVF